MKTIAVILLALLAGGCMMVPNRSHNDGYYSGKAAGTPGGTELICHKGKKTMELPSSAVGAHLGHGDYRGRCR